MDGVKTIIRGLLAVAIVGAVAVWVVASGGEAPSLPDSPGPRQSELDAARAAAVESHAARLRARLADMPARPEGERNPFRYEGGTRASHGRVPRTVVTGAPEAFDEPPPAPARPELRLIGMAEDTRDGLTERTAVVAGLNQVYLVKEGEQIAMRFLVTRIGADAIEVEDLGDSTRLSLGLR
jgi:hypothetical protein